MSDLMTTYTNPSAALTMSQDRMSAARLEDAERLASMSKGDLQRARATAEDFEAVFLTQMLQPIFDTVPKDSLFGAGPGEQVYKTMLVSEFGKSIAKAGGVGIADHVMDQILKLQEA